MKSVLETTNFFMGNNPEDLVGEYGTPLYVYNERIIRDRMRAVSKLITKYPYTANYSVKANSNTAILKIALSEGINCDAVSEGEIRLLERVGYPYDKIFFVPNNVSDEELRYAIERGIMVSLDSLPQLERYGRLNGGSKCALRINPGIGAGHHKKVVTAGKDTKFGISPEKIPEALEIAKRYNLTICGINQHVGSLFMEPDPYVKASENILKIAETIPNLEFVDLGGGMGTPYHKLDDEASFDMTALHDALEPVLDEFVKNYGYAPLFKSEPGRYCVSESSVILGRVYATKSHAGVNYAGTDIGMNVLARPTLYDSWHDVEILRDGKPVTDGEKRNVTICGNICESGDKITDNRELPVIKEEDLVCVLDTGAYGYSMSYTYNTRRRPAEILISPAASSGSEVKLIRKRETFEDLMALLCQ